MNKNMNYELFEELSEYLHNNMEEVTSIVSEINSWNGELDYLDVYNMDEFYEMLEGYTPYEIVNMVYFGHFNPTDEYFMFDAYGNIESCNRYELDEDYMDNMNEITQCIVKYRNNIWISSNIEEILNKYDTEE